MEQMPALGRVQGGGDDEEAGVAVGAEEGLDGEEVSWAEGVERGDPGHEEAGVAG